MKVIQISKYGPPENLKLVDRPIPDIKTNELLIYNSVATVNPYDCMVRSGSMWFMEGFRFPKVLGASMRQISAVLLHTTFRQVAVAMLLSTPIAFYLSQDYLQRYTDQIKMQWWHFAMPVAILAIIMFFTVASVLYKAAKSNPVEALRTE